MPLLLQDLDLYPPLQATRDCIVGVPCPNLVSPNTTVRPTRKSGRKARLKEHLKDCGRDTDDAPRNEVAEEGGVRDHAVLAFDVRGRGDDGGGTWPAEW